MYNNANTNSHNRGNRVNVNMNMNMNVNENEDDAMSSAALIDSYFLPGGILDPEESTSGHGHVNSSSNGNVNVNGNGNGNNSPGLDIAGDDGSRSNPNRSHGNVQSQSQSHSRMLRPSINGNVGRSPLEVDINNTEALRSRLEQLTGGRQSQLTQQQQQQQHQHQHQHQPLAYSSNSVMEGQLHMNRNMNMNVNVNMNVNSSTSESVLQPKELPRVGVAALDPTADDVVGGRTILMGPSLPITPSAQLQMSSATLGHAHANAHANANTHGFAPNSDWFALNPNPTETPTASNIKEDFSNFFRGALHSHGNPSPSMNTHAHSLGYAHGHGHGHGHNQPAALPPMSSPSNPNANSNVNGNVNANANTNTNTNTSANASQNMMLQHAQTHASFSSTSNESRTTNATSHVQRNPWSNEDLSDMNRNVNVNAKKTSSAVRTHGTHLSFPTPTHATHATHASTSTAMNKRANMNNAMNVNVGVNGNVNINVNNTNMAVSQTGVRPPPGFLSSHRGSMSSQPSGTNPVSVPSVPEQHPVSRPLREQQQQQQQQRAGIEQNSTHLSIASTLRHSPAAYNHEHDLVRNIQVRHTGNHTNTNTNTNTNTHTDQQPQQQQQQQQLQMHAPNVNVQRKNKPTQTTSPHHNDGDYDQSSLNTKSSRDVPSTIYVEEDAVSTSEDTLTVCADSVTEASVPTRATNCNKSENERVCMDVVEETSAIGHKRNKPKRNKKKKAKKRQQQNNSQEVSVKSKDNTPAPAPAPTPASVPALANEEPFLHKSKVINKHPQSDGEQESKETKKTMKINKKTRATNKKVTVSKTNGNSRSSAATTAVSSTASTAQRVVTKKTHHSKSNHHETSRSHGRGEDRKNQNQNQKELIPRETVKESMSKLVNKCKPFVKRAGQIIGYLALVIIRAMLNTASSFFPRKERFWFLLPVFCVLVDFFFLACTLMCKVVGQIIYLILIAHKLVAIELVESEYAAICYSVVFFYPSIVQSLKAAISYQDYWPVVARWLAVHNWFCRPITMKDTYLYRLRKRDRRDTAMNIVKLSLITGDKLYQSLRHGVDHVLRSAKEQPEESERVTMANHILLILRKVTPLILMLEINIRREGFLVLMTSTERILFGYGFAVLRSGYLFSPLIWISWTVQLTIIMFVHPSAAWSYFIFMIGLVSIRLSHYTAAVEDLEGVNAMNGHATAVRRKKASRVQV